MNCMSSNQDTQGKTDKQLKAIKGQLIVQTDSPAGRDNLLFFWGMMKKWYLLLMKMIKWYLQGSHRSMWEQWILRILLFALRFYSRLDHQNSSHRTVGREGDGWEGGNTVDSHHNTIDGDSWIARATSNDIIKQGYDVLGLWAFWSWDVLY